jgi:hypothetical protein
LKRPAYLADGGFPAKSAGILVPSVRAGKTAEFEKRQAFVPKMQTIIISRTIA